MDLVSQPSSLSWWLWLACGSLALIFVAATVWLLAPVWIADRLAFRKTSDRLAAEDSYRKALAQIFGFPLALLGGLGLAVAVVQALATYQAAQEVAYQAQYQRGFDALASSSSATRIGGL